MRGNFEFDLTNILSAFQRGEIVDRPKLMEYFRHRWNENTPAINLFLAEVGTHAVQQNLGPVQVMRLGIIYGTVIGILLEQDRLTRQHIV